MFHQRRNKKKCHRDSSYKIVLKKVVNNPKQIKPNDNQPTINQQAIPPKLKTILKITEEDEIQEYLALKRKE